MISNPVQAALVPSSSERPAIDFCRLKMLALRKRDRVTGRVKFPYEVCGRSRVPKRTGCVGRAVIKSATPGFPDRGDGVEKFR